MFHQYVISGDRLFSPTYVGHSPGMPTMADHNFRIQPDLPENLRKGSGLYAIFRRRHDSQWELAQWELAYIGRFIGPDTDVFGGDIISARWARHIATLSLRGVKISISINLRNAFTAAAPTHPIAAAIAVADPEILRKDRGFQVSANRITYGARLWSQVFSQTPSNWLGDIVFGYVQLDQAAWATCPQQSIWVAIDQSEADAIGHWLPPLNGGVAQPRLDPLDIQFVLTDLKKRLEVRLSKQGCCAGESTDGGGNALESPTAPDAVTQRIPQRMAANTQDMQNAVGPPDVDADLEHAIDAFDERLPDGYPRSLVDGIRAWALDHDDVEIHHTLTNNGDLRVRIFGGRQNRNVFVLFWQAKNQRFFCRALVAPNTVLGPGIANVAACPTYEPLWVQFTVQCVEGALQCLLAIIDQSRTNYINGTQRP